jgi:hypothetical protein
MFFSKLGLPYTGRRRPPPLIKTDYWGFGGKGVYEQDETMNNESDPRLAMYDVSLPGIPVMMMETTSDGVSTSSPAIHRLRQIQKTV